MKNLQFVLLLSIVTLISACKTQEDIRREKTVENLNEQVAQTQKSTANANSRFTTLEEQMAKLTGLVEESAHNKSLESKENAQLKERIATLEENNKKQNDYLKALNEKLQEQSKYIDQVIKSLSSLTEQKEASASAKKKEAKEQSSEETPTIKGAIAKYRSGELEDAKADFLKILEIKKLKKKDKEAGFFYLGMIEYKNKSFEEAKVYFSKLFSENPDSSYGAQSLLNLAKTFTQLKAKDEAKQTLDELITRFPKSKEAQEGTKLKAKI